jgi:hypothetical protein
MCSLIGLGFSLEVMLLFRSEMYNGQRWSSSQTFYRWLIEWLNASLTGLTSLWVCANRQPAPTCGDGGCADGRQWISLELPSEGVQYHFYF